VKDDLLVLVPKSYEVGSPMAISNELSSDIANAILAAKERSRGDLKDLKEVVLKVHKTLQQMTEDARASRPEVSPLSQPAVTRG
jgi:hypothetical protein